MTKNKLIDDRDLFYKTAIAKARQKRERLEQQKRNENLKKKR